MAVEGGIGKAIVVDENLTLQRFDRLNPDKSPETIGKVDSPIAGLIANPEQNQTILVLQNGDLRTVSGGDSPTIAPLAKLGISGKLRAFSGTNNRVAIVSEKGELVVVNASTGEKSPTVNLGPAAQVVAFSQDLKLAAIQTSGQTSLFDVIDGKEYSALPIRNPKAIALSTERRLLVAANDFGGFEVWDFGMKERLDVDLPLQFDKVWHMEFLAGGDLLVVGEDGVATLLDSHTWRPFRTVTVPRREDVSSISTSKTGQLLIVLKNGTVATEDLRFASPAMGMMKGVERVSVWYGTSRGRLQGSRSFLTRWCMTMIRIDYLMIMGISFVIALIMLLFSSTRRIAAFCLFVPIGVLCLLATLSNWSTGGEREASAPGAALSNELSTTLSWGKCVVSVPSDRRLGAVPEPKDILGFEGVVDPEQHFILLDEKELSVDAIFDAVREEEKSNSPDELLVFVHGFNVPFESAAKRTAQLKVDLRIDGPAFLFSWPSYGREVLYTWDEDNAEASVTACEQMLRELSKRFPSSKTHVIAHSMGSRIVMEALCRFHKQTRSAPPRIDTLIIAAPDVDRRKFAIDMADIVKNTNIPLTLYASSKDWALTLSYMANKNYRLGHASPELVIADGMETIDASRIDTDFLGHGYYGDARELLGDIFQLVKEKRLADKRFGLTSSDHNGKKFWILLP